MRTRQEAIQYCLSLGGCYEDYPFRDPNWTVIPAYHLNKKYWNSIILDGTVPEEDVRRMIQESYRLTGK